MPHATAPGLADLESQIRDDLALMDYPSRRSWCPRRHTTTGVPVYDVVIVGGGQGGTSVAIGLLREKIDNILVVDQNPAGREGPWRTFARMITLRTPKHLTGPDHGIPSLTCKAWYEAQHGEGSWERLGLIPKETWCDYVSWLRDLFDVPVRNETKAGAIRWDASEGCFEVPLSSTSSAGDAAARTEIVYARKVVLATGIAGSGAWQVPALVREGLEGYEDRYAHTRQPIDFDALSGKRVGVLGAGASAFDNASVALEAGAAEVRLFFRRETLPRVNPYRWAEFVGFLRHHADLDDARKWRFIREILVMGQLPPTDTFERATRHDDFHLHPASPWTRVEPLGADEGGGVQVTTPHGVHRFDFLIIGTGFVTDLSRRPELEHVHEHVALWADRYTPPDGEAHLDLARHPYLGPGFEFEEKQPGQAPWVRSIFNYTFGGLPSLGFGGASISGMKYSLPRIVGGITGQLYAEDADHHLQSLRDYDVAEF